MVVFLVARAVWWAARTPVARRLEAKVANAVKNELVKHHMMPKLPNISRVIPKIHIPHPRLPPGMTHAAHVVRTQAQAIQKASVSAARTIAKNPVGKKILHVVHEEIKHEIKHVVEDKVHKVLGDKLGDAVIKVGNEVVKPAPIPVTHPLAPPALESEPKRVYNEDHGHQMPPETHIDPDPHKDPPHKDMSMSTPFVVVAVLGGGALFYLLYRQQAAVPAT